MHPQLALLLEIQDLRSQHRELKAAGPAGDLQVEHFNIDLKDATAQLQEKIDELETELAPPIRSRYQRVAPLLDRVVVPVINGVCYGCFVSIATARAREPDPNDALNACETCGRFLYIT